MQVAPQDRRFYRLLLLAATPTVLALLLIIAFLLSESVAVVQSPGIAALLADSQWLPNDTDAPRFGLLAMLFGSAAVALGAVVIATPTAVWAALYSHCVAPPWLRRLFIRSIELLAAIPSVILGLCGLVYLVPWVASWAPPGAGLLTAMLLLALMILPTIALSAHAALSAVPKNQYRAAAALGLSDWAIGRRVLLPAAKAGVGTGVILAMGRALGETMVVLMVAGNVVQIPQSLADPIRSLSANIALEMGYAVGAQRSALFASGLLLTLLVVALVLISHYWIRQQARRQGLSTAGVSP